MCIRQLVDMRDSQFPKDVATLDVREMRALLTDMRLDSKGSGCLPPPLAPEASLGGNGDIIADEAGNQPRSQEVLVSGAELP